MNIYQSIYDLLVQFVFNNEGVVDGVLIDQMQHLVVTLISTCGYLFLAALPFVIVYWFIKVVCTAFGRF